MIVRVRNPRRVEIYISAGRHTAAQVRTMTGADLVINGGLYDMGTMRPNCHLRVMGVDYASDPYNYIYGYGWPQGSANLKPVESRNKATVDNYICCSWMVTGGKAVRMVYAPETGGRRGNTGLGVMPDGSIVADVHTEADPVTPEELQAEMTALGVRDAMRLDGGLSSQLATDRLDLWAPDGRGRRRTVHNYICIWGDVEPEKEESMTEKELRQLVLDTAAAWKGKKESDGSFREIIDLYNAYRPLPVGYKVKYTDEWCATFVSAVFIKVALTEIAPPECSCQRMIELHKALGTWQENDDQIPQPGDIIMYDWQDSGTGDCVGWADHTGIVWSVDTGAKTVTVLEGNRGNAVDFRTISIGGKTIRGYCLPNYASKAVAEPVEPESPADYAAAACGKAVAKGVFKGDGKGNYGWQDSVTRQDLCVVLDRLGLLG